MAAITQIRHRHNGDRATKIIHAVPPAPEAAVPGYSRSAVAGPTGRTPWPTGPGEKRENLDLPGPVTAPEQDQELEETTEDEVEEGPQHK
jgi:hypothetical protein